VLLRVHALELPLIVRGCIWLFKPTKTFPLMHAVAVKCNIYWQNKSILHGNVSKLQYFSIYFTFFLGGGACPQTS